MTSQQIEGRKITDITITPVAFSDPPLLNAVGVHEPWALRAVIEVTVQGGVTGLGESYGDLAHLQRLEVVSRRLIGVDIFAAHTFRQRVKETLEPDDSLGGHGMSGMVTGSSTPDRVLSPFDVAALDIQGKLFDRPVSDLLGGAVHREVPFSGYLFYKWPGHPGMEEDDWGPATDPDAVVAQAKRMVADYGFTALKLKGGVFDPREEMDAIRALRVEFPDMPLRLDPNAAWNTGTAIEVGQGLDGVLEYLEDPTPGLRAMAAVRREVPMPLATNMCVVGFDGIAPALKAGAVDIILSDHHFWGGLRRSQSLAAITDTFGLGLSMHSNSHLGISLAAMVHLASATPGLDYACDTHWPWKDTVEDVIVPGSLQFLNGAVAVPTAPGLGIDLDRDALARLHEQYLRCGQRNRDDTGYMQKIRPDFMLKSPRW